MDFSKKARLLCHAFPQIFDEYSGVVLNVGSVPGGQGTVVKSIDTSGDEAVLIDPPIEMKMVSRGLNLAIGMYFVEPPTFKESTAAKEELRELIPDELHRFVR